MKTHDIPLGSCSTEGKISSKIENGELILTAINMSNHTSIPNTFKLPFRINAILKSNISTFSFKTGKGGVRFSAEPNSSGYGILRSDIVTGKAEPIKFDYDCELPLNEYVDLSIVYGSKGTWIEMNGKYCYFTRTSPYVSFLESNNEEFTDGFDLGIWCGKNAELQIQSLTVTEYNHDEPDIPAEIVNLDEISPFEWYVKGLPPELREEVIKIDDYLLNDMKSSLKFKRSIDTYGNVTYEARCGFVYTMIKHGADGGASERHETSWVQQKPDKPDYTSHILNKIAESSPDLADKLFSRLWICPSPTCKNCSVNVFKGESKETCYSIIVFNWLVSEFEDVRKVVAAAGEVMNAVDRNR